MTAIRALFRLHPALATLLAAAALAMKLLVPSGFMPVIGATGVTIQLCPAAGAVAGAPALMMHHAMTAPSSTHGEPMPAPKAEMPCAFAGLAAPTLAAADVVLLAAALAFVALRAVRGATPTTPRRAARLRPPLRAPPRPA